jgi:glycosyltransferase involved in cell wall biosynthesis
MRIAIFHDYLENRGGGERVTLVLAKNLNADVFTTKYLPEATFSEFKSCRVHELGRFTSSRGLMQTEMAIRFFNARVRGYDAYIYSGTWCLFAAPHHSPNLWYCHTPTRMLYDLHHLVRDRLSDPAKAMFVPWSAVMRFADKRMVSYVDSIVCNSKNVQKRIRRFYGREATVIYPPVDTARFYTGEYRDYYLSVSRFRKEKRLELQIEAFKKIPDKKLRIVGSSSNKTESDYEEYLKKIAPPNVEFLGSLDDKELLDQYANCTAVLYTPIDEDFGLVPIEANAAGKPAIAVREGGCLETVQEGKTGLLIDATPAAIVRAVRSISRPGKAKSMGRACLLNAKRFDQEKFIAEIKKQLHFLD